MLNIYKLLDFLIYSHALIGLAALCLTWECFAIMENGTPVSYLLLVFFASSFLYSVHRYVQVFAYASFKDPRVIELIARKRIFLISAAINGMVASGLFAIYFLPSWELFITPVLLGLTYVLPFNKSLKRIRDLPYIKVLLIALCWTWITLIIPVQMNDLDPMASEYLIWSGERLLFIIGITIPFDIRDSTADRLKGLRTLVTALGNHRSKLISYGILLCSLIPGFFLFGNLYDMYIFTAICAVTLLAISIIYFVNEKRSERFYSLFIDGLMIAHGLVLVGIQSLHS